MPLVERASRVETKDPYRLLPACSRFVGAPAGYGAFAADFGAGQRKAADLLRVPVGTVEDWRLTRSGPPWVKLGRYVRYEQGELLAWVQEKRHG